jgi:hypothetical protein
MENQIHSWNKTLKFSWGHIIAFVALIFISYVAYMGDIYSNGGNFGLSLIKISVMDALLLGTFIGAQVYKGTDERFARSIIVERILLALAPIAFVWTMFSYNHFWAVHAQREHIEQRFAAVVKESKDMFAKYDDYANTRVQNYEKHLTTILANKGTNNTAYTKAGFDGNNDALIKDNYIETLKLQLKSQNMDSLKISALAWIDEASTSPSVWNAFIMGNVRMISDAIEGWNERLYTESKSVLSNEPDSIVPFDAQMQTAAMVKKDMTDFQKIYTETRTLSIHTIWTGILLFCMLLLPYFLQQRNTRAQGIYTLWPKGKKKTPAEAPLMEETITDDATQEYVAPTPNTTNNTASEDDIYGGTL